MKSPATSCSKLPTWATAACGGLVRSDTSTRYRRRNSRRFGLNPYTNPADNLLLTKAISDPAVIAKVGNILPYSGYSTKNTLLNALRPFPQFSTITVTNSPTGNTWYDSLQVKGTKRLSHGLQVNGTFTWSKAMASTREDLFNPASAGKSIQATDQPFLFNANIVYDTPKASDNKILAWVTRDWQLGAFLQYGSGLPLTPPAQTTANNLASNYHTGQMVRTGQPLFMKDLNCGCINPYVDQVLNPAAWANPTAGTFGPGCPRLGNSTGSTTRTSARRAVQWRTSTSGATSGSRNA